MIFRFVCLISNIWLKSIELIYNMENKKLKSNSKEDYDKALASADPTTISKEEQERLTKEAIKKFKSL